MVILRRLQRLEQRRDPHPMRRDHHCPIPRSDLQGLCANNPRECPFQPDHEIIEALYSWLVVGAARVAHVDRVVGAAFQGAKGLAFEIWVGVGGDFGAVGKDRLDGLEYSRQGRVVEGVDLLVVEFGGEDSSFVVAFWGEAGVAEALQGSVDVILGFAVADKKEVKLALVGLGGGHFVVAVLGLSR